MVCSGRSLEEELDLLLVDGDGAGFLRNINLAILDQSSMIAGPSGRLIESLRQEQRTAS